MARFAFPNFVANSIIFDLGLLSRGTGEGTKCIIESSNNKRIEALSAVKREMSRLNINCFVR